MRFLARIVSRRRVQSIPSVVSSTLYVIRSPVHCARHSVHCLRRVHARRAKTKYSHVSPALSAGQNSISGRTTRRAQGNCCLHDTSGPFQLQSAPTPTVDGVNVHRSACQSGEPATAIRERVARSPPSSRATNLSNISVRFIKR